MREGWVETTLGEVAKTVAPSKTQAGERYVGLEHFDSGNPRISRWGSTDEVLSSTTAFEPGDVLFGKLRPYLKKVAVADHSGRCSTEALVYRPKSPGLTGAYLGLLLQDGRAIAHANGSSAGSRMPRTSSKDMAALGVALPRLAEQERIVDLIGALDEAIEAADADVVVELHGQLLEHWMRQPGEALSTALTQSKESAAVEPESDYRVLGVLRSGQGFIDHGAIKGSETTYPRLFQVRPDQLVYRKLTAWEGPISVSTEAEDGGWVSPEFPVFDIDPDVLLPDLLRHMCRWPGLWHRIGQRLVGSVQRRKRLNPSELLKIEVPMPGLAEQQQFCEMLDGLWESQLARKAAADDLRALRSNLLTALLSGEHEIPESYDELMVAAS